MHQAHDKRRLTPLAYATLLAFSIMPDAAFAQDRTAGTSGTEEAGQLHSVVISAQKRKESASKVPASVSVIGAQQLENQHVTQLSDLNGYLPGVQIENGGTPGKTAVKIRGIGNLGPGPVVGTYLDDTPVGSSNNIQKGAGLVLDMLPYDIARVEVLRGPQGTLYGASSMGGLLKYVTIDPDLKHLEGRIGGGMSSVKGGQGSGRDMHAGVNIPLIKDTLALRASLASNQTPGWVGNAVTGARGINRSKQQGGRLALLWQASQDVSLKLSAIRQKIDANDNSLITLDKNNRQPVYGSHSNNKLFGEPFERDINYYSATLNWDLHWADFTSATSHSRENTSAPTDISHEFGVALPELGKMLGVDAPIGKSRFPLDIGSKKITQEFRLMSKPGGKMEWLAGAFYTKEDGTQAQTGTAQTMAGASIPVLDPLLIVSMPSSYKEAAVFGNLGYKFSDRFDISAGLRHAQNRQRYQQIVDPRSALALLGAVPNTAPPSSSSESVTTYMLSPRYLLSADSMLYVRVATGYRPGGPNIALPGVPSTVNSDSLINYEAGIKSSFLNRRASIELAAYQIDWKDIQISTSTDNGLSYAANAGKAQSRGVELSSQYKATQDWRLGLVIGYTAAYLSEDAPKLKAGKGDRLPGTPRWNAALTSDYNFSLPDGWAGHVGGGYSWIGERQSAVNPARSLTLASFGTLNLNADVSKDAWTVRLYAKNLANNQKLSSISPITNALSGAVSQYSANRPQPRTIGMAVDMQF
ncbi:Pesticin receptor precursor [compost metagenome]